MTRLERWVRASFATVFVDNFAPMVVQGLGRLDVQLNDGDQAFLRDFDQKSVNIQESIELSDRFTLSYLWVLGAYELVRTISRRLQSDSRNGELTSTFLDIKREFARLRMPLAKMEPASAHRTTDSPIAFPALHRERGISWHVAPDVFITRLDLADNLLSTLERARELDPKLP